MEHLDIASLQNNDDFAFLMPEDIKLLQEALSHGMQENAQFRHQHGVSYTAMSVKDRLTIGRSIYRAQLTQAFTDKEGITFRTDRGGFYILFYGVGLIHLKKLDRKTLLAWIPKELRKSSKTLIGAQLQLALSKDFVNDDNVPLNELKAVVLGLIENRLGEIEFVYLTKQVGDELLNRLPLEIITIVPFERAPQADAEMPTFQFKAKKKDNGTTEPGQS